MAASVAAAASTANGAPTTPLGSPRPGASNQGQFTDGSPPSAAPAQGQRRTSWRDWGSSIGSWANASPFRTSTRPTSSSSSSTSTFSFGPTALGRSRADVVALPPSKVSQTLIETDSESMLQEGERLRLPPTPAELEALEAAGVQDEEDLRLEAEERERVRSMPPPPRHHSVFGRLAGRLSAQSSPRSALPTPKKEASEPTFTGDDKAGKQVGAHSHTETPARPQPEPAASSSSLTLLPSVAIEDSVPGAAQEKNLSGPRPSPEQDLPLSPPPTLSRAAEVPSLMVFSATSQSMLRGISEAPQIPVIDSVAPSPSHSHTSGRNPLDTPLTPDDRFGYDSGAYELPNLGRAGTEPEGARSVNRTGTESENDSAKEDLIPVDMYSDSEPDETRRSGSSTPELVNKRKSRGTNDRFSLLLNSLARPSGSVDDEVPDRSATPLGGGTGRRGAASIASSSSEYAASSASSYAESDAGDTSAPDDTVVIRETEAPAQSTQVTSIEQDNRTQAVVAEKGPDEQQRTSQPPLRAAVNSQNEADEDKLDTPLVKHAEAAQRESLDEARSSSTISRWSVSDDGSTDAVGMQSLGEELSAVGQGKLDTVASAGEKAEVEADVDGAAVEEKAVAETVDGSEGVPPQPVAGSPDGTSGSDEPRETAPDLRTEDFSSEVLGRRTEDSEASRLDDVDTSQPEADESTQNDTSVTGIPASATSQTFLSFSQSTDGLAGPIEDEEREVAPTQATAAPTAEPDVPPAGSSAAELPEPGPTPRASEASESTTPSDAKEAAETTRSPTATATHNRLMDVLGLSRPDSPAASITSASSFASAISVEDGLVSRDEVEGDDAPFDSQAEQGRDEAGVQHAEVRIEGAEPLALLDSSSIQLKAIGADDAEAVIGGSAPEEKVDTDPAQLLGSPRVPGSPAISAQSGSSSRPLSSEFSSAEPPSAPTSTNEHGEGTPIPAQAATGASGTSTLTPPAAGTVSPSLARPARNRNRKGPAPTPPAPSPIAALGAVAAAAAASASKRSSVASTSAISANGSVGEVEAPACVAVDSGVGAPSAPAVAAPPSRPPRARPPRSKGRPAPLAATGSAEVKSAAGETTGKEAGIAVGGGGEVEVVTPSTPGGSKKPKRKAVPRAD
ncbi:hypothetical protein V8E36_006204 [Tilletia maclaganii]